MASRTSKKGIAAKKTQQQKNKKKKLGEKKFEYPKRNLSLDEAKEYSVVGAKANPKGHTYHWFLKGRKVCWETGLRVDPDGYRYILLPNGKSDYVEVPFSGWVRKKIIKKNKQIS